MHHLHQRQIVNELAEIITHLQIAPRRVLIVRARDHHNLAPLMQTLAERVDGHYVDHLADCVPQLSDFPLEAYKPVHLREDLKALLDKDGKTLIVGELEWALAIWNETEQRIFFQSMTTFTHRNVLVLVCRLALDYETLIEDRRRVFRLG